MTERQTDRQREIEIERDTDRQRHRQTDRQTQRDLHGGNHTDCYKNRIKPVSCRSRT